MGDAPAAAVARIDGITLAAIAPRFSGPRGKRQAAVVAVVGPLLAATLPRFGIDTPRRAAHFLGQLCHESCGFSTLQEMADGRAYEGRKDLGNTQPGDGPRFKGRGLIQLTGRGNYALYSTVAGVDLVADPKRAADPAVSLVIAGAYWQRRGLNALADRDDLRGITLRINGGLNGLEDRRVYVVRAKGALGLSA